MQSRDERRFWSKVALPNREGCMLWMATTRTYGYGTFWLNGNMRRAHRVAYEHLIGPIPDGMVLDHLCRVRHCVAIDHLEVVTLAENTRRGNGAQRKRCPQGHAYDVINTYVHPRSGGRHCRTCRRLRERERYAKSRQAN